jgi:hypothetical protein
MNPIIYNSCVRYTIYEYSFIYTMYIYFFFCGNKCYNNCSSWRYIESNTGKSARQGNLRHPRVRFQSFADEATPEGVGDFPVLHFLPVFDFISHFLSAVFSFVFVCIQSYFSIFSDVRFSYLALVQDKKNHVRITRKCMLYSLCQLSPPPPNSPCLK